MTWPKMTGDHASSMSVPSKTIIFSL